MHSARHIWHVSRPTISRALNHVEFSVPRYSRVSKFSCITSRLPKPPARLLNFRIQQCFRQRYYSSKTPSRDDKSASTGSQINITPNEPKSDSPDKVIHENIYTLPNLLTVSRIVACPVLGWAILSDEYLTATGLLVYAGVTDWVRRISGALACVFGKVTGGG